MGLKLYNQRPENECITGLSLTPLAQIKTCALSIGGGGLAADLAVTAFKLVAAPMLITAFGVAVTFLYIADNIENFMNKRALHKGDVTIKVYRRPKINP